MGTSFVLVRRYSTIVRATNSMFLGPRELSMRCADAVNDIHGPGNRMRKGEFYDQIHPAHSLQFNRDHSQHKYQRRFWDKAFQPRGKYIRHVTSVHDQRLTLSLALQEYTPRVVKYFKSIMGIFAKCAALSAPIDVTELLMDLFFDVISDLTLGESFRSLETGQRNPVVREFLTRQKIVGFALLNTWMLHLLRSMKSPRKHEWYANALRKRKQVRQHHILRFN